MRRKEQVNVVGHEAVGVHGATMLPRVFRKVAEVRPVIGFGKKARLAVDSPLHDMQWTFGQNGTRRARHDLCNGQLPRGVDV
jgi:hypothetical protein